MKKSILALFFLFLANAPTHACECIFGQHTLKEWVAKYEYIFYAEVPPNPDGMLGNKHFSKLKVKEIFKGKINTYIREGFLQIENDLSLCSQIFNPGEKILIFANEGKSGYLSTSTCDLNRVFASEEDFRNQRKEIKKATRKKLLGIF